MSNDQLEMAIADIREQLNEVYNDHAEMKEKLRELRILAGIEMPVATKNTDNEDQSTT